MTDPKPVVNRATIDQAKASPHGRPELRNILDNRPRVRVSDLREAKRNSQKWVMLTSYDTISASVFDAAKVPCILVGDSAAQVVYGRKSTLSITVEELLPIAKAVASSCKHALVIADLPFGSYRESPKQALRTANRFMKEAEVHAVKIEGGSEIVEHVKFLTASGVPVMAHIGFTPQSEHTLGGFKVQGREEQDIEKLVADAKALEAAGAFALVVELVPADVGQKISDTLRIPVVGIGAGSNCDAQVLVWTDFAGFAKPVKHATSTEPRAFRPAKAPKFVKPYVNMSEVIYDAVLELKEDVKAGLYPGPENSYQ